MPMALECAVDGDLMEAPRITTTDIRRLTIHVISQNQRFQILRRVSVQEPGFKLNYRPIYPRIRAI